jgi:hypothetical protein
MPSGVVVPQVRDPSFALFAAESMNYSNEHANNPSGHPSQPLSETAIILRRPAQSLSPRVSIDKRDLLFPLPCILSRKNERKFDHLGGQK